MTKFVLDVNRAVPLSGAVFSWAARPAINTAAQKWSGRIILEPESKGKRDAAHAGGRQGQVVRGGIQSRPDARDVHLIQNVGGIETELQVAPLPESKAAAERRVEGNQARPGNGVAPGSAELAGQWKNESRGIEEPRAVHHRKAGRVGAGCARGAGAGGVGQVAQHPGAQRRPSLGCDAAAQSPVLQKLAGHVVVSQQAAVVAKRRG